MLILLLCVFCPKGNICFTSSQIISHMYAFISLRFESIEIVKLLLEKGANQVIASNNKLTPLHSAARRGNMEICRLLLGYPGVKDILEGEGFLNPLHFACLSKSRELCELFLRNGADVMSKSTTGYPALHLACFVGSEEICELLIENGNIFYTYLQHYLLCSLKRGCTLGANI